MKGSFWEVLMISYARLTVPVKPLPIVHVRIELDWIPANVPLEAAMREPLEWFCATVLFREFLMISNTPSTDIWKTGQTEKLSLSSHKNKN